MISQDMQDHDSCIQAKAKRGAQSYEGITVSFKQYFKMTGLTVASPQNAPFLNFTMPAPLVVHPSANIKS